MFSFIIASLKLFFFVFWMVSQLPILCLIHFTPLVPLYAVFFFKVVCFILGIKVRISQGSLAKSNKLLILSNHTSYLDIFALNSVFMAYFVSKDDVKKWPLFGLIANLGNTIYISRNKMKAKHEINILDEAFEKRNVPIIIFPEGTSSNGCSVLPFKSSIFAMFESSIGTKSNNNISIQPISIAYVSKNGVKMNDEQRAVFSWWRSDQTIVNHLFSAIRAMPVEVQIIIHEPVDISKFKDRKQLAIHCQKIVEDGFYKLIKK